MSPTIVASRFIKRNAGWLDLATGRRVPSPAVETPGPTPPWLAQTVEGVVRLAGRADGAGFRVAWVGAMASDWNGQVAEAVAPGLAALGYVTLDAGQRLPRVVRRTLARRHVALVCGRDTPRDPALEWIRELSATSGRSHVLVIPRLDTGAGSPRGVGGAPPAPNVLHVRERAVAELWTRGARPRPGGPQLRRAEHCSRRGRHAAGERWLRAAVEAGRRCQDDDVTSLAGLRLVDRLSRRGRWGLAVRAGRTALGAVDRRDCRVALSAAVASVTLHNLDFDDAAAILAGAVAESAVLGLPIPNLIHLRCAELWFWQGRLEQARAELDRITEPTDEVRCWREVLTSAAGGRAVQSRVLPQCVGPSARSLAAAAAIFNPRAPDERFRDDGAVEPRPRVGRSPLEAELAGRSEARVPPSGLGREISGSRVSTVAAWKLARSEMHLIHAVPGLLQILAEAEDDATALASACAWLRRQPGVRGAALLGTDGRWVAADGIRRADLSSAQLKDALGSRSARVVVTGDVVTAMAPVRYAGRSVGAVITRGSREVAETLCEASATLAPLCGPALRAQVDVMAEREACGSSIPEIVGVSPAIEAVRQAIGRTAGTGFSVLVEGESGTGKELVARALHRLSARKNRAFCPVNCAALTDELVEAELFGFARGAFTGAVAPRTGLFEEASGSTLFLDEIGELTPRAQAKLLRALQEGEIRRLGENIYRRVDVRIVAATNRPLAQAASAGTFREDLLFRLAVARIRVPPLRDRVEDIPLLARNLWAQLGPETGTRARLAPDALAALCHHSWPGNVRELQNAIAALVLIAPRRGRLSSRHVAQVLAITPGDGDVALPLGVARRLFERGRIAEALARHGGRRAAAARELGLSRQGLSKALRRVGLAPSREEDEAGVA